MGANDGVGWVEMDEGSALFSWDFRAIREEAWEGFPVRRGGWRGKARSGLKSALVGMEGRLSGRGSPTPRIGNVCLDHGFRSWAMLSIWSKGLQVRVEPHPLAIG